MLIQIAGSDFNNSHLRRGTGIANLRLNTDQFERGEPP